MRLIRRYTFEAAHVLQHLPEGHPCTRLHGHGYVLEVTVMGDVIGHRRMVAEYAEVDAAVAPVLERYDHQCINDFMEQPTVECMAPDIFGVIEKAIPEDATWCLARIRLWETERSSVEYP